MKKPKVDVDFETGEVRRFPVERQVLPPGPHVPVGGPVALPIGQRRPETLHEAIARMVRQNLTAVPTDINGDPLDDSDLIGEEEELEDYPLTPHEADYLLGKLERLARMREAKIPPTPSPNSPPQPPPSPATPPGKPPADPPVPPPGGAPPAA